MKTAELAVTKFNISVVVVNSWNAIIYKFFSWYSAKDA